MNHNLKAPVTIGSLLVLAVGIAVSTAWSPPVGDENVIVPAGQYITAAGPIESHDPATTANVLSTLPALVVGHGNDNYRTGASADVGAGLVMGTGNKMSTRLSGHASAVIGETNDVRSRSSVVAGANNNVTVNATALSGFNSPMKYSVVGGYSNTIDGGAEGVSVGGRFNTVRADTSLVAGQSNTVEGPTTGTKAVASMAVGSGHHIMSTGGWAIGANHQVSGYGASAMGINLIADSHTAVVVGTNNEASGGDIDTPQPGDPVFVVGNGTSTLARSNALIVKRNGDVVIPKVQGDISMGIYGD